MQLIFKYVHLTYSWVGSLSGTTIQGQIGPGNNGNEEVLHTPQIYRIGALPSDTVYCYT